MAPPDGRRPARVGPRLVLSLALGAASLCCDEEPEPAPASELATAEGETEPDEVSAATPYDEAGDHGHGSIEAERAPWVAVRAEGTVEIDGMPFGTRTPLRGGELLRVGEGGLLVLDTDENARYEIRGEAAVRVGAYVGAQLLLLRGDVHAVYATGEPIRTLQRIAGPGGTVTTRGVGELWVTVLPSGATWAAALSIPIDVTDGLLDAQGEAPVTALDPGRAVLATDRVQEPTDGPRSVDSARSTVAAMRGADPPFSAAGQRRLLQGGLRQVGQALDRLEAELARGETLRAEHRTAVAEGSDRAAELQSAIVQHATRRTVLFRAATAAWERVLVRAERLRLEGEDVPEQVSALEPRVRAVLSP